MMSHCRDLFVTLSTIVRSNPRDLNLGCWEDRIPWIKTYRRCLRANFESNDSYEPVHRSTEKYMTFRTPQFHPSLHPSKRVMIARAMIGSSEISAFNERSPRGVFFRVTLPRWHTETFVGLL